MEPIIRWRHPLEKAKDPPTDAATIQRCSYEKMNHKLMGIDYNYPPKLYADNSGIRVVNYNSHFLKLSEGFRNLVAAHAFCGKVAVTYGIGNDVFAFSDHLQSLYGQFHETVELELVAGRDYAQFPFKPVVICDDGHLRTIQGLIGAHQELMSQIKSSLKAADLERAKPQTFRAHELEDHSNFKLFPTLKDLFVITDNPIAEVDGETMFDTQHRALLVVLREERKDAIDTHLGETKMETCEMNGQPVWTARAGLKEIMHALIKVGFPDQPHFPVRITEKADLV